MPFVDWQLSFCHTITGVSTLACLLAASISVEAVTPPLVGMAFKEQKQGPKAPPSSNLGVNPRKSNSPLDVAKVTKGACPGGASATPSWVGEGRRRIILEGSEADSGELMTTFSKPLLVAVLTIGAVFSTTSTLAQPRTETAGQQLFQAINRERAANGLPPLKWDEALANAARQHAEAMAAQRGDFAYAPRGTEPSQPGYARRWQLQLVVGERRGRTECAEHQRAVDAVSQSPCQPAGCGYGHNRRRCR